MGRRLVQIFQGELNNGRSKEFRFKPNSNDQNLVGLLALGEIEVSIASSNGLELMINNYQGRNSKSLSPDKRILQLNKKINKDIIRGVLRMPNIEPSQISASVYLVIEFEKK